MIYLTKEDWNNLILSKLSEQASFNEQFLELKKIQKAFRYFCEKMYQKNEKNQTYIDMLLIGGMTIFHKYRICSNFSLKQYSSEELYVLIGACFFIGQKSLNILINSVKAVANFIKTLILSKEPTKKVNIKELREKLINKELEILMTVGFDIDIDLPFSFSNKVKKQIAKNKLNLNTDNVFILLKIFMEDSLILPLPLYYTPNIILISCVIALKRKYNLTNINIKELIPLSEYNLDEGEIQDCVALIKKIEIANTEYIKNQKNKAKITSDTKTIEAKSMNSDKASVTKIIPSINVNIN